MIEKPDARFPPKNLEEVILKIHYSLFANMKRSIGMKFAYEAPLPPNGGRRVRKSKLRNCRNQIPSPLRKGIHSPSYEGQVVRIARIRPISASRLVGSSSSALSKAMTASASFPTLVNAYPLFAHASALLGSIAMA